MPKPVVWHLFVDESGDFDRETDKVVVAGIGLRLDRALGRPDEIRRNLERLVPGLAWPLHLAVVKTTSALALAPLALRWRAAHAVAGRDRRAVLRMLEALDSGTTPSDDDEAQIRRRVLEVAHHGLAIPAREWMARHADGWKRLLKAFDQGRNPIRVPRDIVADFDAFEEPEPWSSALRAARYLFERDAATTLKTVRRLAIGKDPWQPELWRLDHFLRRCEESRTLAQQVVRVLWGFRRILETLAQSDGSGWPGAFLCFAGESQLGDFEPPGDGGDRYLSLLEAMLTRVAEVLSRWSGSHEVRLYVCGRKVVDPWIGVSRYLHIQDLVALQRRIEERLGTESVRLVPIEVPRYADTQDPGFVLADFVASVARGAIGNRDLRFVEVRLKQEGGIMPRSAGRTHVQAAGSAWRLMDGLRRGERMAIRSDLWPWAREQAMEWGSK